MPDMKKLDDVLESLEFCRTHPEAGDCDGCDYGGYSIVICESLVNDAIELLCELSGHSASNVEEGDDRACALKS